MRGADGVGQREERVGGRRWFGIVDVEGRTGEMAGTKGVDKGGFVDQRTARNVDQIATSGHKAQGFGVDHMTRLRRGGAVQGKNLDMR